MAGAHLKHSVIVVSFLLVLVPTSTTEAQEWSFVRGDVNGDGQHAIGDSLVLLEFLFLT